VPVPDDPRHLFTGANATAGKSGHGIAKKIGEKKMSVEAKCCFPRAA
jgi:hypothetical protein